MLLRKVGDKASVALNAKIRNVGGITLVGRGRLSDILLFTQAPLLVQAVSQALRL